jgi:hypothetical protein
MLDVPMQGVNVKRASSMGSILLRFAAIVGAWTSGPSSGEQAETSAKLVGARG